MEIKLTRGKVALVDDCDYERLSKWKWHAHQDTRGRWYARRGQTKAKRLTTIFMHREILGLKFGDGLLGDHVVSGNTLDNRRSNLRIATARTNAQNARRAIDNKSGFKGVYPCWNGWISRITINGALTHLGRFASAQEAHLAYCYAAAHHFGEFARFA